MGFQIGQIISSDPGDNRHESVQGYSIESEGQHETALQADLTSQSVYLNNVSLHDTPGIAALRRNYLDAY